MERKRKHELNDMMGFLHNISPVKRSSNNNLYFNGMLQIADDIKRVVSFDADKHDSFSRAEKLQSPVKLTGVTVVPSRDGKGTDVQINSRTTLTVLNIDDIPFKRRKISSEQPSNHLKIRDIKHPSGMITIHVKVVGDSPETMENLFNRTVAKKEFIVADESGSIFLNVWENQINLLKVNKFYKITFVASRLYDTLQLTTTPQTTIEETKEKLANISTQFFSGSGNSLKGEIKLVSLTVNNKCSSCKKVVSAGIKFTRCDGCNMKQLTVDLLKSSTLKINLLDNKNQMHRLTAFQQTIQAFLKAENLQDLIDDIESFEEYLLGKRICVTVNNDICYGIKIDNVAASTATATAQHLCSSAIEPAPSSSK